MFHEDPCPACHAHGTHHRIQVQMVVPASRHELDAAYTAAHRWHLAAVMTGYALVVVLLVAAAWAPNAILLWVGIGLAALVSGLTTTAATYLMGYR